MKLKGLFIILVLFCLASSPRIEAQQQKRATAASRRKASQPKQNTQAAKKKQEPELPTNYPKTPGRYFWGDADNFMELKSTLVLPVSEVEISGIIKVTRLLRFRMTSSITGETWTRLEMPPDVKTEKNYAPRANEALSFDPDEKPFIDLNNPEAAKKEVSPAERAALTLETSKPVFIFYLKEHTEIDIKEGYLLVRMDASRRVPLIREKSPPSFLTANSNKVRLVPNSLNVIPFSIKKFHTNLTEYFLITPEAELGPGEYGFYQPGAPVSPGEYDTLGFISIFQVRSK